MIRKTENVIIYVVDDDEFQLKLLQNKFQSSTNYRLFTFQSGESFIDYLEKTKLPKRTTIIVILDYFLSINNQSGIKNGLEILKNIKQKYPELNIIMYSISEDIDIATLCMHHGAANYIKKNENSYSRIQNTINWIISESSLKRKSAQTKQALSKHGTMFEK
ncbi:MAG: response regulator [Bacteroidia bacterium]|nr:response regulator [Bacteroidia bacterium]